MAACHDARNSKASWLTHGILITPIVHYKLHINILLSIIYNLGIGQILHLSGPSQPSYAPAIHLDLANSKHSFDGSICIGIRGSGWNFPSWAALCINRRRGSKFALLQSTSLVGKAISMTTWQHLWSLTMEATNQFEEIALEVETLFNYRGCRYQWLEICGHPFL